MEQKQENNITDKPKKKIIKYQYIPPHLRSCKAQQALQSNNTLKPNIDHQNTKNSQKSCSKQLNTNPITQISTNDNSSKSSYSKLQSNTSSFKSIASIDETKQDNYDENCNSNDNNVNNGNNSYLDESLIKGFEQFSIEENNKDKNENKDEFKWYDNEELFEKKLGVSLSSDLRLNDATYRSEDELNKLTKINIAKKYVSHPTLVYVIGPPAIGKSSIYDKHLLQFGNNAVNSDGDLVRRCHFGVNKYLKLSNDLNIGFNGFFRYYIQKWSSKWKLEIRNKAMINSQNIIAFSTCHRFDDVIEEIDKFFNNGYYIKILMVCGEYDKCCKMGMKRERYNGRKYLHGAYCKSMQGCIDVIEYLLKNNKIDRKKDLIVIRNKYQINENTEILNDEWRGIKHKILIPMKKRAIQTIRQYYKQNSYF